MQVTINTLSDVEREADFAVPQDELQPHFELAYEEYRPKVDIKGFRKGRVPLAMVKQMYGQAIEYEALEKIAGTLYRQAMQERNVVPIGRPVIEDMDFKRGEQFTFKIKFEVKPEITLKGYKDLALTKIVHPVTDDLMCASLLPSPCRYSSSSLGTSCWSFHSTSCTTSGSAFS